MKFTDRYLQSLKPREKEYCIREGHGFTIRILPSGCKTFQYIYTLLGKRRRHNLGIYPTTSLAEAREKYLEAATLVSKGADPKEIPTAPLTPENYTVSGLVEDYLAHLDKSAAKSYVSTARLTLANDVLPAMGSRLVVDIRRRDAVELIEKVAARAPAQGQGVLKFARAMFTFALHRERVDFNPFAGVSAAVPSVSISSRDRVLSDDEIKHVWSSLSSKDGIGTVHLRAALLLILVTAQRPGEVVGISVSEVDEKWWTIPKERTKNKNENRVYLPPLAIRLLPTTFCQWYFPSPILSPPSLSIPIGPIGRQTLSHILSKSPKDKKGKVTRRQYLGLPRWTPHDLRRTAATKLSELGCPDEIIDAILNHVKQGIIGVYNRNRYDAEKKLWLAKWAEHLEKLTKPGQ